jgi:hypothetical protein
LSMRAIERDVKRSQSTQMNQSNQLFHIFCPPTFKCLLTQYDFNLLLFE